MSGGPWYNISISKKLHGNVFEGFIRNVGTEIYHIMCYIDAHEKIDPPEHDDGISGGGYSLPSSSIIEALFLLGATIYFIGCRLKTLEHNFLERYHMYVFTMEKLFQKTQLNFLNNPVQKKNANRYYMLLEVVGI